MVRASCSGKFQLRSSILDGAHVYQVTLPDSANIFYRFLRKTSYRGGKLEFYNGILLLSSFFLVRICYGWYTV